MHDQPAAHELVAAVRRFLEETARPALSGHAAFHARVAENALAIVERELLAKDQSEAAEKHRLINLLQDVSDTSLESMNRSLCDAIRSGKMTLETPGLFEHLKATAIAQIEVDQPRYSGLATATKT